ncbi:helix-turn-helix domain-containing protein [Chryseolinea soli]|uniref:XRE family transcriptional regulator n=1 Tax=Chryseolinea soli TaxID=2321403 RepID=A0A385SV70_9BACT|nr:helix-turn-helix transcriptional regulator [Chryseolinea soli]AYB34824.1 XRE family transcriptional regulator [Chryseolinea soli]
MRNKDKEFQKAFGKHVRRLREEKQWSQDQLATESKMEVNQISRIENGRHAANMHTIKAIAIALGKYPDELLRFEFPLKLNTDFSLLHRKKNRPATTATIIELLHTDYLEKPRSVLEITEKCADLYSVRLNSSATSGVLKKLVIEKKLKKTLSPKRKGSFLYEKRIK